MYCYMLLCIIMYCVLLCIVICYYVYEYWSCFVCNAIQQCFLPLLFFSSMKHPRQSPRIAPTIGIPLHVDIQDQSVLISVHSQQNSLCNLHKVIPLASAATLDGGSRGSRQYVLLLRDTLNPPRALPSLCCILYHHCCFSQQVEKGGERYYTRFRVLSGISQYSLLDVLLLCRLSLFTSYRVYIHVVDYQVQMYTLGIPLFIIVLLKQW